MYGDYEAQRHWMEITINVPVNKWCVFVCSQHLYAHDVCVSVCVCVCAGVCVCE